MISQQKKVPDSECIAEWQSFNSMFNSIVEKKPKDAIGQCEAIKKAVAASTRLTARQVESLNSKCNNYISGDYGNTKTPENLSHNEPSKS